MAEGGEDSDKDNPFSFKSFVTKKDKKPKDTKSTQEDDDIDIFSMPEPTTTRRREKPKQIVVVDEQRTQSSDGKTSVKKKGKTENPFSFKKFLSGSNPKDVERRSPVQQQNYERLTPPSLSHGHGLHANNDNSHSDSQSVPNLHVAGDLPDFVQDHFVENINTGTSPRGIELPDFTIRDITENGPDLHNMHGALPQYGTSNVDSRQNEPADDFDDMSDNEDNIGAPQSSLVHSLPDFLSDGAVSSSINSEPVSNSQDNAGPSRVQDNLASYSQENQRLRDENERLRRQVEELTSLRLRDAKSISDLQNELVEQKKKEVEETTVMEQAMIQVEENLSVTTKRAIQAEAVAAKLKQDVKALQTELKALKGENGILPGERHLSDIKERTSYVAEQLSTATKTAETSLRQLLSGVDNLKLLSQVLASIDKISEEPSSSEHKHNPTSS